MTDRVADRVSRYVLDGSDADLRRLLGIAQVYATATREALVRAGVEEGWRALECGCGPVGALPILSELVGPSGSVLGVDFVDSTVERARSVTGELGIENVDVIVGDVNDPDIADRLGGPFDVAFTRCFLMHQANPRQTLARIAELVRPGGRIVCHEPLRTPVPRSHPDLDVDALGIYWELMHKTMVWAGANDRTVDGLPSAARALGLEIMDVRGYFLFIDDAEFGFELHAASLAAFKTRVLEAGLSSEDEVDALIDVLRSAKQGGHDWVTGPAVLDLTLRKPS